MLDDTSSLFNITDLKQYIYCPRIFFFHTCLPDVRPVTHKMEAGIESHELEQKRAVRRSMSMYQLATGERRFDVRVTSSRLMLTGLVDELIATDEEIIPVDYKLARKAGHHFKLQLAAYSLLLEENDPRPVKRAFLYLIPIHKPLEIPITPLLRREVESVILTMKGISATECMPPPTDWRQKCVDCEFRRFCNDV